MTTQTQNKRTQTSMPHVGFEPTIPVFERAKTMNIYIILPSAQQYVITYLFIYIARMCAI
jgi:hypothetical protein